MKARSAGNSTDPVLVLNTETAEFAEPTTYFLPTPAAITGLAKLACFDVLATRTCTPSRFALVGRASLPDEVQNRSAQLRKVHEFGISDIAFQAKHLDAAAASAIRYAGTLDYREIDMHSFATLFPSQPNHDQPPLGTEVTEGQLKNFLKTATS